MKYKKLLFIFLLVLLIGMAFFQNPEKVLSYQEQLLYKEVEDAVKQYAEPNGVKCFNGIIVVAKDGRKIYQYANGYADIKNKKPINEKTNFNLASLSKQFTATAIMVLYEQGKLDIDDPINKYIPELDCKEVTIRHLLTHTGLLLDFERLVDSNWTDKTKPVSNGDVIRLYKDNNLKPYGIAGSYYSYSNTGYLMLATIVERVSEQEFNQFMQTNIFKPMDMNNSLSYSLVENPLILNRAYGYRNKNSIGLRDVTYLDGVEGPGGIYSSAEDLLKWDEVLRTERLLKKETIEKMFVPYTLNNGEKIDYGFGWAIKENEMGKIVFHDGSWAGFRTRMVRNLYNNYSIIFLSNVSDETTLRAVDQIEEILCARP